MNPERTRNETPKGRTALLRSLGRHLLGGRPADLVWLLLLGLAHVGIMLVIPVQIEHLFNRAADPRSLHQVFGDGALLLLTGLAASLFAVALEWKSNRMLYRSIFRLEGELFAKMLQLEMSYGDEHGAGYVQARVQNDVAPATALTAAEAAPYLVILLQLAGALALLLWIDRAMAAAAVLFALVVTVGNAATSPALRRLAAETQECRSRLSAYVQEAIRALATLKTTGSEEREGARFAELNRDNTRLRRKLSLTGRLLGEANTATGRVGFILIAVIGALRIASGALTPGAFVASAIFINILLYSSKSLVNYVPRLSSAWASLERIREFLELPEERRRFSGRVTALLDRSLALGDVHFAYPGQPPLFRGLSLEIPRGAKVALVGPSGSGKTTLAKMLLGFLRPSAGSLRIGGIEIEDLELGFLRRFVGYVSQDEHGPLRRSLRENLCLARPEATEAEVVAAAHEARAHDFILSLDRGYDAVIGEDGRALSGGEAQRIALARELLRRPGILVVDEATAHLDMLTEKAIVGTILSAFPDTTCLIISHRLGAIVGCDRILVLDAGAVREAGTHGELMARRSLYHQLYTSQVQDPRDETSREAGGRAG